VQAERSGVGENQPVSDLQYEDIWVAMRGGLPVSELGEPIGIAWVGVMHKG